MNNEEYYLIATKEVDGNQRDEALWAKSLTLVDGDENQARYKYIKMRVAQWESTPVNTEKETAILQSDQASDRGEFFTASALKFTLMSACTCGLYEVYWFYKNWVLIKERTGDDIMPFWRAAFAPFWAYSLFKHIKLSASESRIQESLSIGLLAFFYIVVQFFTYLPDPFWLITLLSFTLIIPVNSVALKINDAIYAGYEKNNTFTAWNWVGLMAGSLMFFIFLSSY